MKLSITLKQSDADGFGGELLETLGMNRALRDPKTFVKELAVTELLDKFTESIDDDEEDDKSKVDASAGAFTGRRRRRRRRTRPTDFLLYEDNSLYALPYLEPLTDRGIVPLRVNLRTDSTAILTPINASVSAKSDEDDDAAFLKKADRLVNESIARLRKAGKFKSIDEKSKLSVVKDIARMLREDSLETKTVVSIEGIDDMVSKKVVASSDEELAVAALELAQRALAENNTDPQVVAAIKAAALTLAKG